MCGLFILLLVSSWLQDGCLSSRHNNIIRGREEGEGTGLVTIDSFSQRNKTLPEADHRFLFTSRWSELDHLAPLTTNEARTLNIQIAHYD